MTLVLVNIIPVLQGQRPLKAPAAGHIAITAQCIAILPLIVTSFVRVTIHCLFYAPTITHICSR